MKVIFLKYARQELDDATQFYEMEFSGLGRRFREEVKNVRYQELSNILKHGLWNEGISENTCFINSPMYCSILLKRCISLSLQLRISTENQNTGLIGK